MEFIEELIRKGPGKNSIKLSIQGASEIAIDDYWADVCIVDNLKNPAAFEEAWEEWFNDYDQFILDIVDAYHKQTEGAMIWTLYDKDEVAQCLKEEFLEPILYKESCYGSWHPDIEKSMISIQNEE